jgi:hypothetical protein
MVERHHASPEALATDRHYNEALQRLSPGRVKLRRFPRDPITRKGNLAEIVLAEYICATTPATLPVYRLRYNPNVDQSMKGDDVLAFDLDSKPYRVIVGEAKFRQVSSTAAVTKTVAALLRSHRAGLPVSMTFVADRLIEHGNAELAARVHACALAFARDELRLEYVGLLLSDRNSSTRVRDATPGELRRLAMISLGVDDPNSLADACYAGLE